MAQNLGFDKEFDDELFLKKAGKRIRELEKRFKNRQAAAEAVGRSRSTFQDWGNGERDPSFVGMARLAQATNTSLDEIAFGLKPVKLTDDQTVDIPRLSQILVGEPGNWLDGQNIAGYVPFDRRSIYETLGDINPENLAITTVFGDSMHPTITSDDILFIDLSVTQILDNALYAMQWDDALVVKRIQRRPEGATIISDNKNYENQVIDPEKVEKLNIIGVIKWMTKSL